MTRAAAGIVWPAAGAGAVVDLAVLVPVLVVYTALHAGGVVSGDAATGVTAVVAVFVAPAAGGATAARRAPDAPLTNSATAAAVGVGVYLVFRVVDAVVRHRPLSIGAAATLVMLSVLLGMVGGLVGSRVRRR